MSMSLSKSGSTKPDHILSLHHRTLQWPFYFRCYFSVNIAKLRYFDTVSVYGLMLTLLSTKTLKSLKIPIIFNYTNGTHLIKKKSNATDIHYRDNYGKNFGMHLSTM